MTGSIQSDQRCPRCGGRFKSFEPRGLWCPDHPDQMPTHFKVRFNKITRRFDNYNAAFQFLTHLRAQAGAGQLDLRDHEVKSKPLAFETLADAWLEKKAREVRTGTMRSLRPIIAAASTTWAGRNIKSIDYGDIEDWLAGLPWAGKTKANALMTVKELWAWCEDRHNIPQLKKWPRISFEMGYRKTIDLATQEAILADIREHEPYRTWLGIRWLATYISVRPAEMTGLLEKHIDRNRGLLLFPHPKERTPKLVPLIDEDIEIVRALPQGFPDMHFFRLDNGSPYGRDRFYYAWKRACKRLGIEDVDLYGGTKHSTAMALRSVATFEEVRTMTQHTTNKAFERYFRTDGDALKNLYARRGQVGSDHGLTTAECNSSKGKLIDITDK